MVIQTKSCTKDSHLIATHTIAPKSNLTALKTSFETPCKSLASFTFQVIDQFSIPMQKGVSTTVHTRETRIIKSFSFFYFSTSQSIPQNVLM